jgi:hypothetical protein
MDWPAPDNRLTPGDVVACTTPRDPAERREVTLALKRRVAAAYGYTGPWMLVEFDHRIPFSLCGSNDRDNLWPEPADGYTHGAFIHNRKDELEQAITDALASGRIRTLGEAQQVFRGDWRKAWCVWVHDRGVTCPRS